MNYAEDLLKISRDIRALENRFEQVARASPTARRMMDEAKYLPHLNTGGCADDLVRISNVISSQERWVKS